MQSFHGIIFRYKKIDHNLADKKVAELQKEKVSQMQLDGVSRESAMPKKNFNEQEILDVGFFLEKNDE